MVRDRFLTPSTFDLTHCLYLSSNLKGAPAAIFLDSFITSSRSRGSRTTPRTQMASPSNSTSRVDMKNGKRGEKACFNIGGQRSHFKIVQGFFVF